MNRPIAALAVSALALAAVPGAGAPSGPPDLQKRLARAELLAGLTPVEGPGLVVTLANSPKKPPKGVDQRELMVGEQDVNAVLNALRAGGSEALAIAGKDGKRPERVLAWTAVRADRKGVEVHDASLQPPFRLLAIGDPKRLREELYRSEGVVRRLGLDTLEMIRVEESERIEIPAAQKPVELRFARAISNEPPVPSAAPAAASPQVPAAAVRLPESRPINPLRLETNPPPQAAPAAVPPAPAPKPEVRGVVRRASSPKPGDGPSGRPETPDPRPETACFGGKGLTKYHVPGCRFGERIAAAERVRFGSLEDARREGRKPCQVCCPEGPAGAGK
jgi:hypothetical protein